MSITTYSSKKVSITVAGQPITGVAEDSFVICEFTSDAFTKKTGADGEVTRSANPDQSGTVTIKLMASSESNAYLSALALADKNTLLGTVPVMIKDNNGTDLVEGNECWITKQPKQEYGKEVGDREWKFEVSFLNMFAGGNF